MSSNYRGLPAAASVEQAIVLAQLLILRDLERRTQPILYLPDRDQENRSTVTNRRV